MSIPSDDINMPDDKNTVQYAGKQDDNIMITFQQRVEASSDSSMYTRW